MLTKNDLLILGLLLDRPMHGYEIAQTIKAAGVDTWMDISTPAVYYSLNKLHRLGLVSATRVRGDGAERSVYYPTEKGREAFFDGMEDVVGSEKPVHFEYDLGIFLLNKLPQERALTLLEKRVAFLLWRRGELEKKLEEERAAGEPLRVAILQHAAACTRMDAEWLDGIIRQLKGESGGIEGYQGLMLLTGDLHDFHLPDLIKLIVSGQHSGTLTVTDGTFTRTITFHQGRPVCATSRRPDEEVRDPQQIMSDIYDLFRWQEGAFTFDQRMGPQEGCLVLQVSAASLILNGARWVDNWTIIQRVVPSPDIVFERREQSECPNDLELIDEECQVLEALDGLRDVTDVARACGLTEFETSKILYGLHAVGLVQPGDLDKVRLRRVFRELAELMCKGTKPYRLRPDDFSCELEVNARCAELPVRFVAGRIEDQTDPSVQTKTLVGIYRRFLHTQQAVVRERFGEAVAQQLLQTVCSQISPGLKEALKQYDLIYQDGDRP